MSDYEIVETTSGGKAGKGYNKTSSVQIRQDNCIVKQFRYDRTIAFDRKRALEKAGAFFFIKAALAAGGDL